mmetsp:Transcript_25889/g.79692  ORF Transcript_25889/g.79692 Transcript_25889/m.79692 type:complete len:86 (-) Transcript_25889:318-575(-)
MRTFLRDAGFDDVQIQVKAESKDIISAWMPGSAAEDFVASAYVTATKPRQVTSLAGEDLFAVTPVAPVELKLQEPSSSSKTAAGC